MKYILFCNIAWMQYYDYSQFKETAKHGGSYVVDTGDAFEKYNFHTCKDGRVRGFVETKYTDGAVTMHQPRQLRIENIDSRFKKMDKIDGVTVVFCAHSDELKQTVIVGWYQNATVYRNRPQYEGRQFNLECAAENAHLLLESMRDFEVPRARKNDFGFGQANVWYAKEENATAYVEKVMDYIAEHSMKSVPNNGVIPQEIPKEYEESGIGKSVLVNKYERNPTARRKCLELHGANCIICGFNASLVYGEEFKDKIEVHHIVPISEIGESYRIDPAKDLIPVCPNCHMILHSRMKSGDYPTVETLKANFRKATFESPKKENKDEEKQSKVENAKQSLNGGNKYIGRRVFHTSPKFGYGVIEGEDEIKVRIRFDDGKTASFEKKAFSKGFLQLI